DRFGLGPFFRIEPLGMEYVAAALEAAGHRATVVDLRYSGPVERYIRELRPGLVGIACMHALETDEALALAEHVRRLSPDAFIVIGGHSAAAYSSPFFARTVDAVCVADGELVMPLLADALDRRTARTNLTNVPGLLLRSAEGEFRPTPVPDRVFELDEVPQPLRRDVDAWRKQYACLLFRPVWLIETARGCPFRCSFCSVWQLLDRGVRFRSIESVCDDFAATGPHVFVADDLFWYQPSRSRELAEALKRRGIRKRWLLVQSRTDLVANHADLLEAWRPIAQDFDIFFGLEAATNEGLTGLVKDTTVDRTLEAVAIAREHRYGVTGNFVIDPDWDESDFERLWKFVEQNGLDRAGFTVLTPLPGTTYFDEMRPRLRAVSWGQYDMHHLLWEPRLGAKRFFELYCETWRRSILNLSGHKSWRDWARQVRPADVPFLTRMLLRTQRMMKPAAYLTEHRLSVVFSEGTSGAPTPVSSAAGAGR
ncbi:MAG TPA: radical SAM protein, partial [Vicinamibacterales bacterium]|nr:radical SAM protein [Vicinamibacterales bacterium]